MAPRPIFCATHPRACSTAFERVFMTRRDTLQCVHEPFGDAYYFGPERLGDRFMDNTAAREASGSSEKTYRDIFDSFMNEGNKEGKRIFIKDMAYYLFAPDGGKTALARSLVDGDDAAAVSEPGNPTNIPLSVLRQFHFTFLIRHPRRSIPSYWRCTVPPLQEITGFDYFTPSEAGYAELVRLFDFLIAEGIVDKNNLTVLDADDMLDNPEAAIRQYCDRTGINFTPGMLQWTEEDKEDAAEHFAKWNGFHDDAINTMSLQARTHKQKTSTVESENAEWAQKFGPEAAKSIRATVDANIPHYEYLKQFSLKV